MLNINSKSKSALIKGLVPLALLVALSGCKGAYGELDDVRMPDYHYERYPIEVTKGTVKLQVPTKSSKLSAAQEDAVTRLAQQARSNNVPRIYIRRPSGSITADVVAGRITRLMTGQGVSASSLAHSSYKGSGPVVVSFKRYFATTARCGDWSTNLAETGDNTTYANYGCAGQHNLAALVANPKDLVTPRTSTPADAMRRSKVFDDYRKGQDTTSQSSDKDKAQVSDIAE